MRDFFIKSLETVVGIIIVVAAIGIVVAAGSVSFGAGGGEMGGPSGPLAGLAILVGGALYLIIVGGFMYLGLGIYQNTRRTADAVEQMASR